MHLRSFQQWSSAFQRFILFSSYQPNSNTTARILLAQINHANMTLILQTLFTRTEMLYDAYTLQFVQLLSLIKTLVSIGNAFCGNSQGSAPSFEEGIIVPLGFIIVKCRHFPVRK